MTLLIRLLTLTMLLLLSVSGLAGAQTKVSPGDTIQEAGWFLTDTELVTLANSLKELEQQNERLLSSVAIADSLYVVSARRVRQCRSILASSDSLLTRSLEFEDRTFFEKIPDWVWLGAGVGLGIWSSK